MSLVVFKKDGEPLTGDEVKFELIKIDRFGQVAIKHSNGRLYLTRASSLRLIPEFHEGGPCCEIPLDGPMECIYSLKDVNSNSNLKKENYELL